MFGRFRFPMCFVIFVPKMFDNVAVRNHRNEFIIAMRTTEIQLSIGFVQVPRIERS